jgi:hypothetical protein
MPELHNIEKEEEEVGGVWTVEDGAPALLENFIGLEHTFMAKTSNSEALEPDTLAEAKRQSDWLLWETAIEEELDTLEAAGTWRLEEAPPGANIISSKWVFRAKKDTAGSITCRKARVVAKEFSQVKKIDYDDTYAPVA